MTYIQKSGNKYHAKSTEYGGVVYHSKKEAAFARELDLRMNAKDLSEKVVKWDRQVRFSLKIKGIHLCNYYLDFVYETADGLIHYCEVKGFETSLWQLKWRIFEAMYKDEPNIILEVIK